MDHAKLVNALGWFNQFFDLDKIRRDFQDRATEEFPSTNMMPKPEKSNFVELLRIGQYKKATGPRDHIYALLGLAKISVRTSLFPDYSKPVVSVYREAFKLAVNVENNLEVLEMRNHLRPWLPTWVPDFAASSSRCFPTLAGNPQHKWSAGGDFPPNYRPQLSDEPNTLKVRGMVVDVINKVVDLNGIENSPFTLVHSLHETALSMVSHSHSCTYLIDSIWRTLVGDRTVDSDRVFPCPRGYRALYMEVVQQAAQGLSSPNRKSQPRLNTTPFLQAMYKAVRYYRISPHR
jgi:hypothetical protein